MRSNDYFSTDVNLQAPFETLYHSHDKLLQQLVRLAQLPALVEGMLRARAIAGQALEAFGQGVLRHHADEERDLFPAVTASARRDGEQGQARALAARLTQQHRQLEAMWKRLEPSVRSVAHGGAAPLDAAAVAELVHAYREHATLEEHDYLPLAERILSRDPNHMAAFGLALHLRRVKMPPFQL